MQRRVRFGDEAERPGLTGRAEKRRDIALDVVEVDRCTYILPDPPLMGVSAKANCSITLLQKRGRRHIGIRTLRHRVKQQPVYNPDTTVINPGPRSICVVELAAIRHFIRNVRLGPILSPHIQNH